MPFPLTYQGQLITLVLAALYEVRGIRTKQETIAHIESRGWFDMQPGDEIVYPSHERANNEPRWHTWIAFGRQWAVERDLMSPFPRRDQWEISQEGIQGFDGVRGKLKTEEYDVRRGYFWSPAFKKWLCPSYTPSDVDAKRPPEVYAKYV